eukprot:6074408-Lingulodinium_polyedra.AAC.1
MGAARGSHPAGHGALPGLWHCRRQLGAAGSRPLRWLGRGPSATRRCLVCRRRRLCACRRVAGRCGCSGAAPPRCLSRRA